MSRLLLTSTGFWPFDPDGEIIPGLKTENKC